MNRLGNGAIGGNSSRAAAARLLRRHVRDPGRCEDSLRSDITLNAVGWRWGGHLEVCVEGQGKVTAGREDQSDADVVYPGFCRGSEHDQYLCVVLSPSPSAGKMNKNKLL